MKPANDLGAIHLKKTIIFLISYVHYPVSFLFEVTVVVLNLASPSLVRDDVQSVCKKMIAQLMDIRNHSGPYGVSSLFVQDWYIVLG